MDIPTIFRPSYYSLRFAGFNHDVAKRVISNSTSLESMVIAVGPDRLKTSEDVGKLWTAVSKRTSYGYNRKKGYQQNPEIDELERIAKARDFSLDDIVLLNSIKVHNTGYGILTQRPIKLEDIEGYEAIGITTVDRMLKAHKEGLSNGSDIPEYIAVGIANKDDIVALQQAGINPYRAGSYISAGVSVVDSMVKLWSTNKKSDGSTQPVDGFTVIRYQDAGIDDIDAMLELNKAGIEYRDVDTYKRQGVDEVKRMLDLHNSGVPSNIMQDYGESDIHDDREMKALILGDVMPEHVNVYRSGGIKTPQDMITLKAHNIDANSAEGYARAGFEGKPNIMIQLMEWRISPDEAERYAESGFHSNADAMIRLKKEKISPMYINAQLMLMNGTKPATQELLLNSILSLYRAQMQATPPSNA